jgi:hypothetical protein
MANVDVDLERAAAADDFLRADAAIGEALDPLLVDAVGGEGSAGTAVDLALDFVAAFARDLAAGFGFGVDCQV